MHVSFSVKFWCPWWGRRAGGSLKSHEPWGEYKRGAKMLLALRPVYGMASVKEGGMGASIALHGLARGTKARSVILWSYCVKSSPGCHQIVYSEDRKKAPHVNCVKVQAVLHRKKHAVGHICMIKNGNLLLGVTSCMLAAGCLQKGFCGSLACSVQCIR